MVTYCIRPGAQRARPISPSDCLRTWVKVSWKKMILFPVPGSSRFICQCRLPGNFPVTLHGDLKPPLMLLYNICCEKKKKTPSWLLVRHFHIITDDCNLLGNLGAVLFGKSHVNRNDSLLREKSTCIFPVLFCVCVNKEQFGAAICTTESRQTPLKQSRLLLNAKPGRQNVELGPLSVIKAGCITGIATERIWPPFLKCWFIIISRAS